MGTARSAIPTATLRIEPRVRLALANCGANSLNSRSMALAKFFAELKQRNVYRAAALYAMGAWLVTQVATQVFPFFDISNSAVRGIIIMAVVGFPIAMVLAWIYDLTPMGIVPAE